jgi:hypothetical protein
MLPKMPGELRKPKLRTLSKCIRGVMFMAMKGRSSGQMGTFRKAESTSKIATCVPGGASATNR